MTRDTDHTASAARQFVSGITQLREATRLLFDGPDARAEIARTLIAPAIEALEESMVDGVAGDRLQTILDEEWGPFPSEPVHVLLTMLEKRLFDDRRTRIELSNNLDAAEAHSEEVHEVLRAHVEALKSTGYKVECGGCPTCSPLQAAIETAKPAAAMKEQLEATRHALEAVSEVQQAHLRERNEARAALAATEAQVAKAFEIIGGDDTSLVAAVKRLRAELDQARAVLKDDLGEARARE